MTFLLALAVALPMSAAVQSCWGALEAGTLQAWLAAAAGVARAAIALTIAIVLLGLTEDPPRRPIWLYDWRALLRRGAGAGIRPSESPQG